jgi:hypothetical protein
MYPSTKTKFYSSILKLVIIYSHDRSSMSYLQGNYKLIYICRIASERLSEPTTTFNNFSEGMHKLVILYLSLIWPVKKKLKTDCFIDEKYASKKKLSARIIQTTLFCWHNFLCDSVICSKNFFNSLEYTDGLCLSVFPSVNHRWTNFVGDSGICSKVFSTLWKIPTDWVLR